MNAKNRGVVRTASRPAGSHRGVRLAATGLIVVFAAVGASSCADGAATEGAIAWHDGTVLAVVRKSEMNAAVPMCTSRTGTAPWTDEARVAVVRSRVGKGAYDEAFLLSSIPDVGTGDRVRFERQDCILRKTRKVEAP